MRAMTATVIVSFALMLALGLYCGAYSKGVSEEMQGQVREMRGEIQAGSLETALWRTADMRRGWEEKSALLSLWVNHGDVDEVSLGLERLETALEQEERFLSLLYAAELGEAVSHLYHRDALMLSNIL